MIINQTWAPENQLAVIDNAIRYLQDARKAELDKVFGRLPPQRIQQKSQSIADDVQTAVNLLQKILTAQRPQG
jgi:hypothetical protein